MRIIFSLLLFFLLLQVGYTQNYVDFSWKINHGNSPAWQSAEFTPQSWKNINIGDALERQGYACYAGYYGLWNEVFVPASIRKAASEKIFLKFRFDAQEAEVFINGQSIGKTFSGGASDNLFVVPDDIIRFDKKNTMFVRLHNTFYMGGDCNNYVRLYGEKQQETVIISTTTNSPKNIFEDNTEIKFSVTTTKRVKNKIKGVLTTTIISDHHDTIMVQKTDLILKERETTNDYSIKKVTPGFYKIITCFDSKSAVVQEITMIGVAPEKIITKPTDVVSIAAFWDKAKRELATNEPHYKVEKADSLCTATSNVHSLEMQSIDNLTIRGWYIVPVGEAKHPAVLHLPGYSVAMNPRWFINDSTMIHLALDIRGHGRSTDVVNPGFGSPGFIGVNIDKPEKYIYRGAYMDCVRALDFLFSRTEVDTTRVAVEGHSQGGGLALATASLCPERVRFCAAASPFMSDFPNHIRIREVYKSEMQFYEKHNNTTKEQIRQTMNLIDVVNLVSNIKCPVLLGVGLFDDDCPPYINFAAYNNITPPKEYVIYPKTGHLLGDKWTSDYRRWLREKFEIKEAEY